jgi:hypothetical protein
VERLERDGCIVRRALLPTPLEDTEPCEGQGASSGVVGVALVALRLGEDAGPAGMPERCSGPRDPGVAHARRPLEAPVPPGLRATPFGPWRHPGLCLACGGGGRAVAWCAAGNEPPGGEDGPRSWESLAQGASGRALRALRAGAVAISEGRPGGTERGDEGRHPERSGRDATGIGGEGCGGCAGLDTLGDALGLAHVRRTEAWFEGGTARAWRRLEGRPATQEGTEDRGGLLLQPWPPVWNRGLEGPGQAGGDPPCVTDPAATVLDELGEGAQGGARRPARLQRGAMGEQPCELEGGGRGGVFGPAGRAGFALPRQPQGMEGEEAQKVILAQGGDQGAFGACETKGHGLAVEPRA